MAKIKPIVNDDTAKGVIKPYLVRSTEPPKDNSNLNYRLRSAGGYNPCVRGGYSNGTRNSKGALPNCFSGDTKVITDKGIFTLKELCGNFHNVLTEDGTYHRAEFKSYGKQLLYKITLNNGQSFRVTGNHRWIVYHKSQNNGTNCFTRLEKTTLELNYTSDLIKFVWEDVVNDTEFTQIKSIESLNIEEEVYCCEEPVTHTMVLDGHILTGQCVGYAWGRWREILGYNHNLPTGNAKTIYRDARAKGFSGSPNVPRIGSAAVWGGGTYGHIAIVESIENNGDIWVSDSNYGSKWFRYYKLRAKNRYKSLGGKSLIGFVYLPITFTATGGYVVGNNITTESGYGNMGNSITTALSKLGDSVVGSETVYYNNIEKSVSAMVKARNTAELKTTSASDSTDRTNITTGGEEQKRVDVYEDIHKTEATREEDKRIMKGSYIEFSHSSIYASKTKGGSGNLLRDIYFQYIWNVDEVDGSKILIGWNTKGNLRLNKWVNISDCILVPSEVLNSVVLKQVKSSKGVKVYLSDKLITEFNYISILPKNTIAQIVIGSYKDGVYKIVLNSELRNKYEALYGYVVASAFEEEKKEK